MSVDTQGGRGIQPTFVGVGACLKGWRADDDGRRGKNVPGFMDTTEAILIGRSRYSETSLIVHWFCPETGLFKTMAKGALRPKSAFVGRLDLFVTAELRWSRSRTSDLHTLTEVSWKSARLELRSSYGRVLAATYFTRLIEQVVEPHAPVPEVYELLTKALDYLVEKDPSLAAVNRFEARLVEYLGLGTAMGNARAVRLLEDAAHRTMPVVRKNLLDWIHSHREE